MNDVMRRFAEQKIREAIEKGELDNLPGKGKPLQLEDYSHIPEELRAGYKILKNAGLLPEEMDIQKAIAALEQALEENQPEEAKDRLRKKLKEKKLHFNILMEKRRRG
jgi:hypothetical protein